MKSAALGRLRARDPRLVTTCSIGPLAALFARIRAWRRASCRYRSEEPCHRPDEHETLWDGTTNALDRWAAYFLGVNGLALSAADEGRAAISGWQDRFRTWTWTKQFGNETVPVFQVTKNIYRSHNNIYEETPMLWDFARHYSAEVDANNNVIRYFSPSGFEVKDDKVQIYP